MNKRGFLKIISITVALSVLFGTAGCTGGALPENYDFTDLTVRDFVAENGIVAAANPYAAKAGLDILKAGGNAFDAAVATSFAIGVAECDASGIGGGGLMLAYNVNTKKSLFYNFREFAPANVDTNLEAYAKITAKNSCIETGAPTLVAGLLTVLDEQGSQNVTKRQIVQSAINLARDGVPVTGELATNIRESSDKLRRDKKVWALFSDGIEGLSEGDKLVQTDLANTLEYIATHTKEEFYTGEIANKIVETVAARGGALTMNDMRYALENYPKKGEALSGSYKGYDILTASSPSTGGTMLIEMLNMLECYDKEIASLDNGGAEYINLISTVMQLAYGDKEKYMADAAFSSVPTKGLISKAYAAERFKNYKEGSAYLGVGAGENPFGNPYPFNDGAASVEYEYAESASHYSTTSFSVIDRFGNMVTVTQTINNFFGSGVVPEGTGIFLNNQLKDFTFKSGSVNEISPLKQPASYTMPTVLLKDGKPYATLGSPGASRIPAAVLQVILNMTEFGMNMQEAIAAPRVFCFTTKESDANSVKKTIEIEKSLELLVPSLTAMGYEPSINSIKSVDAYFGGVQGIKVENGRYHGGADPRRAGKALGY